MQLALTLIFATAVIAAFLLAAGGIQMLRDGGDRTKAVLMLVAAAVVLGNVLIWTL